MTDKYTKVAILLHWLIGFSIIALLIVGLVMSEEDLLPMNLRFAAFQLHKSLGLTVLILSVFRLIWRLTHTPPALPEGMNTFEILAAKATHIVFYILMLGLPLTGWIIVSTSARDIPTIWFGLFQWPHLPILVGDPSRGDFSKSIGEVHESLAWIAIALIILHVGAALKHQFINKDNLLSRMIPFIKPSQK